MRTTDHSKAVDLEHRLKVAASQARDDCHNGVIILALRVLEQQGGGVKSPSLDGSHGTTHEVDDDGETYPSLTTVEAAAINRRRDAKLAPALKLLDQLEACISALDDLRKEARHLCSGLDALTYARRCTDGYSKACRDRDMVDPKPSGSGACDACRKARERDRDERQSA